MNEKKMTAIYSLIYFGDSGCRRVQPRNPAMERLLLDMLKQMYQRIKDDSLTGILSEYGSHVH